MFRKFGLIALVTGLFTGCSVARTLKDSANTFVAGQAQSAIDIQIENGIDRVDYISFEKNEATADPIEVFSAEPSKPFKEVGTFVSFEGDSYQETFDELISYAKKRTAKEGGQALIRLQMASRPVGESGNVYVNGNSASFGSKTKFRKVVSGTVVRFK